MHCNYPVLDFLNLDYSPHSVYTIGVDIPAVKGHSSFIGQGEEGSMQKRSLACAPGSLQKPLVARSLEAPLVPLLVRILVLFDQSNRIMVANYRSILEIYLSIFPSIYRSVRKKIYTPPPPPSLFLQLKYTPPPSFPLFANSLAHFCIKRF